MCCHFRRNPRTGLFCLPVIFLLLLLASPAASRIYIDIHSPTQKKLPFAIPAFRHQGGDTANHPTGTELAEVLGSALSFTGLFQILDPAIFLQDPQEMATEFIKIKFGEWNFLGADLLVRGEYTIEGDRLKMVIRVFDVIHQRSLLEKSYEDRVAASRQTILQFADEMVQVLTGEPGIFKSKIAFVGDATGHKELYLADFDGSNIRQLTKDQSISLSPAWSKDGRAISYVGYKLGNPDLYNLDLATGVAKSVSQRSGLNIAPAWHPKGGRLAATMSFNGNPEIYLLDQQGEILKQLTVNWAIDVSPTWSPDGRKLAFVSNRAGKPQIYIMDVASQRIRRLTFEGDYNTSPAWSPQGDRIIYSGMHNGQFDLFMITPDGKELSQLTGGSGNNENPAWSPDGRLILFQSDRRGTPTLWVMLANGTEQRRLQLNLKGSQTDPAWSQRLTRTVP
jgi:TolB protein